MYRQGLLLYKESRTPEGLKAVSALWQKAIDLYRIIGDESKIKELERYFARLSRKVFKPESSTGSEGPSGTLTRLKAPPRISKEFKDWGVFMKVGCFGFGGPVAVLGLLQNELV
ncbi:MAG: chromate transporter, partial [Elusimicrobia bacterium]|nr:chromate transporter [Candidatus Obscuribacterium magneticum]